MQQNINYVIAENGIYSLNKILNESLNHQFYDLIILGNCHFFIDICDLAKEIRKLERDFFNRKSFICGIIENTSEDTLSKCRDSEVNMVIKKPFEDQDLKKLLIILGNVR